MAKQITDNIKWVGKIDWELTRFHGDEYSTNRGSSYNSYLVHDSKTALIDTVWRPYDHEFVSRLKKVINLHDIDYIIMNHNEIDHSGALPELMREIPDTPIYCTKKGEEIIRGHYHQDWNFVNVKTGDTLSLGETSITFIDMAMIHWPDSMMSYWNGDGGILFSNDAFGQHFASESLFNDTVNHSELIYEAEKYFANIINPYSTLVAKKLQQIKAMNLPIKMICPSHGVIWKENPAQIIERYTLWSNAYQENRITIAYDTMWQSTRLMAQAIAEGIEEIAPDTQIKLFNIAREDKNDVLTEIWRSKAFLLGSPTINNGYSYAMAGILEMIAGLRLKNKKAAAFGSYGWSGEAVKMIGEHLTKAGITTVDQGISALWIPNDELIEKCREYGRNFARSL